MEATYGAGGWVRIRHEDLPGPLYLRLAEEPSGRWRIHDVFLRGAWRPVIGADLRELNLSGIEEWLQVDSDFIAMGIGETAPALDDFEAAFGSEKPLREAQRVPRLQRPTNGLTDEFLRHVAAAYRQALSDGKAPAPELARQVGDGATARTIHKWVAIARQRNVMPPAARKRS